MADLDGGFYSPTQLRTAVEKGDSVFFPFRGNEKSLAMVASDVMRGASCGHSIHLEMAPDWDTSPDGDLVHKAFIRPAP